MGPGFSLSEKGVKAKEKNSEPYGVWIGIGGIVVNSWFSTYIDTYRNKYRGKQVCACVCVCVCTHIYIA